MKTTLIVSLLSAASTVLAHGYVQEFLIDGQRHVGSLPFSDQYKNPVPERVTQPFFENGNSFIDDVSSTDIACNKGSKPAKLVAQARAGSEVKFFWTEWPESHKGPVITYLADCGGDCTTAVGSKLNWFKINEAGLLADGTWAASKLIADNNTYTLTLPKKIKNGQYLMRHEIIALHSAFDPKGAQFYPSCTNIEITGATGENSPDTVKIPGAYSATDPGILMNIYWPVPSSYVIPGPPVYTEDGTSSPGAGSSSVPVPDATTVFPTLVPTDTQGIYPTDTAVAGTGGVLPATDVPSVTSSSTTTVTTTFVSTIAGGAQVTFTATYTSEYSCTGVDAIGESTPAPVIPEPTQPACVKETVTVTATITETVERQHSHTHKHKPAVTTVRATNTFTEQYTITVPTATEAPNTSIAGVPTVPSVTDSGFSTIPFPTQAPASVPTAYPTEVPTYEMTFPTAPSSTVEAVPTGTGVPTTGYEGAKTRYDCDQAYAKCKRSYDGCMKRAKRSGMQTRSCEKFKRDVCVDGLRGCDAQIWGYNKV